MIQIRRNLTSLWLFLGLSLITACNPFAVDSSNDSSFLNPEELSAELTLSDGPSFDFGNVFLGDSSEKTFTLSNVGKADAIAVGSGAQLSAPFSFKGGNYPGTGGTCGSTLAPNESCTVVITFAPASQEVFYNTLQIDYFDGLVTEQAVRPLSGQGRPVALLTLSGEDPEDFGVQAIGLSTDKTFILTHSGEGPATQVGPGFPALQAPFSFKGGTYPGVGGTCGASVAVGESCSVVVTFSPTAVGPFGDAIRISYSDGLNTKSETRDVTGTTPADLILNGSGGNGFGSYPVGTITEKIFTLENVGGSNANGIMGAGLANPFRFKGGSFPGTGGNCETELGNDNYCTVVVEFVPTAPNSFTDTIEVTFQNGVSSQTLSQSISGTAYTSATLNISDGATYNFGNVTVGASSDKSFTVSNSGDVSATSIGASTLSAPYTFKGGSYPGTGGTCSSTLGAGSSCTVVVTFAPTEVTTSSSSISLSYDTGLITTTASRAITGTGITPASLSISDGTTYDFGNKVVGSTTSKTFTVTNLGETAASAVTLSPPLSAPYSVSGGTCGTSLGVGASCTVVVDFAPTSSGVSNDTLSISYQNGATTVFSTRAITGTGKTPASLSISDGATYDYGTQFINTTTDKTFTVSNTGEWQATSLTQGTPALSAPYSFKGGSFPGTGGTCTDTLAAQSDCTVVVSFSPTATGASFNDTIRFTYDNGLLSNQSATRSITGASQTVANLSVSDSPTYNFGNVTVGASSDKSFTVSNSGDVSATSIGASTLSAPYTFKGGSYPGTGGTCGSSIGPSSSCTVVVTFAPSTAGASSETVTLNYYTGLVSTSVSRGVTGTGITPASLSISDGTTYDFGNKVVGSTTSKTFTVTNSGATAASAVTLSPPLSAPYSISGGTCGSSLGVGASCTVVVDFAPTSSGVSNDTLSISYQNGATTVFSTRAITGTGKNPASLSISDGATYDYGTQFINTTTDKTFTVSNTGEWQATSLTQGTPALSAPYSFKGGTYPGTGGTCSTSLAASATCTVVVTFSPTSSGASFNDTVRISYDNGLLSNQSATRSITGSSQNPASLSISDATTFDFGNVTVGASSDKSFTVSNSGDVSATSIGASTLSAPYTFKGGSYPGTGGSCGSSIGPSSSCTVVVTFAPSTAGASSETVTLNYYTGLVSTSVSRGVTGTGITPASLSISDGTTYDFGNKVVGSTTSKTFTVTNSGATAASAVTLSPSLSAPYSVSGGTCGTSLGVGASCTVVVDFAPTSSGVSNDTLSISYQNGATTVFSTRAITGTGKTPASLSISDGATYDYGTQFINTTTDKTFTVSNTGEWQASSLTQGTPALSAPYSFKGGSFPGTGGTCSTSLAASSTCTVVVTYNPTSAGTTSSSISLSFNNGLSGGQTATRAITGTAQTVANLALTGSTFGVKSVGSSTDQTFTITNNGGSAASLMTAGTPALSAPFSFKNGSYPGTGGSCGATLAASASCTLIVTFNPPSIGTYSDTLRVSYFDGQNNQTVTLGVSGSTPALLNISGSDPYDYGNRVVGSVTPVTFTITNNGGSSASSLAATPALSAPFTFVGGSYPGTSGTCGSSLARSATCTVRVNFSPTSNITSSGTLSLQYQDGVATVSATRDLTGTGKNPASLSISDGATFDYGMQFVGTTTDKTFTVSNTGEWQASSLVQGTPALSAPYSFKGGSFPGTGGTCTSTLSAGGSCTIVVSFSPTSAGASFSSTIRLSFNNGLSSGQTTTRAITGAAQRAALLTISDGSTYNFGNVTIGALLDKTFTISNTGDVSATTVSASSLTAPFSFKGGIYPGTGGTCGSSIAAGTSCTVVATFTPTASTTSSDTLTLNYNTGLTTTSATRAITGTGLTPAVLSLSDGPTYDFGTIAKYGFSDQTFTISNSGQSTGTSISNSPTLVAPFTFKGGSYPGTGGTCGTSLVGGGSCTVVVRFSPTAVGSFNDTLSLSYFDGAFSQISTRDITGTGEALAFLLSMSESTYDFGPQNLNSSVDGTITIQNLGVVDATSMTAGTPALSAPYSFKDGTYPGTGGTCGTLLPSQSSCTVVVTFNPSSHGTFNDTIRIDYNNYQDTQTLSGPITGRTVALLSISDSSTYDYGTKLVGSSTNKTFTLTNSGGSSATSMSAGTPALSTPFSFLGGTYPGTGGTCSSSLAAGSTCTVVVNFSPTAVASFSNTLRVAYNDAITTQSADRPITGSSQNPASLSVSDATTYDFGSVTIGASGEKTFTVTNSGDVQATSLSASGLSAPINFKGGTYPGTGGTCGTTLSASGACTVVVTFSPTSATSSSRTLSLSYNNGLSTQSTTRAMTGTGITPASISISDGATYDYGTQYVNTSTDKTFTLTNSGGSVATSMAAGTPVLSAPFSFKDGTYPGTGGTCGSSLGVSATCTVVVTFNPTSSGAFSDTIRVAYSDGASSTQATRAITGTGKTPASLSISDGTTYDYGTQYVNTSTDKTFTITNSGGTSATSVAAGTPALSAPYSFKGGTYPGTGGTCSTSIAASATCTVVVTYNPTAIGSYSDTLRISYQDGQTSQTASRSLSGNTVAVLSVSDGSTFDYGTKALNSVTDKTFTITNSGGSTATSVGAGTPALSAPFSFKGGTYPGTGGTCSTSLAVSSTCTLVVSYSPVSSGSYSDTLRLSYQDGQASQQATRPITGNTPALLSISDASTYDFGNISINYSADKTFTVTNQGPVSASSMAAGTPVLSAPFSFKGGTYPGTGGTCSTSLAASSTCTVVVSFAPTASGPYSDTVRLSYSDSLTTQTATRSVSGTAPVSGTLDTSFNTNGTQTYSISGVQLNVNSVALQSDGKIIVAGSYTSGTSTDFMVARFNTDGSIDNSFGSSGITRTAIGGSSNDDTAYGVKIDSSDKIYLAGRTKVSAGIYNWALARYTSSGVLDTTFNASGAQPGVVTISTSGLGGNSGATSEARALTIDPNGKIVVVGFVEKGTTNIKNNFAVARYTSSGSLDTTFNSTGTLTRSIGSSSTGTGSANGDIATGVLIDTANSNAVVVTGHVRGSSNLNFGVLRLSSSGASPSPSSFSFASGTNDLGTSVAIDSSNRVIMGGYSGATNKFGVARMQSGSVSRDSSNFNSGGGSFAGTLAFSIGTSSDRALALAVDNMNRIFLAGRSTNSSSLFDFAVARVTTAGAVDTTFNSTGKKTIAINSSVNNSATGIMIDTGGRVLLVGTTQVSGDTAIALARLYP